MSSTRRLTAIMFADIVGYTAMMQRDEAEGLLRVRRFNEVLEQQVNAHEGEILQFLGDGCLCIFHSAIEAMYAARNIQEELRENPEVPLRIGIHIGDIVMKEGSIYGDGVNLASRIESIGAPGSILVTQRVIHDLKSHPEFIMTSLGKFQFKNVEGPMEVFALANAGFTVPNKEDMGGKLKRSQTFFQKLLLPVMGILVLILGLGAYMLFQQIQGDKAFDKLNKSIVVLPFQNKSGGEDTDYFSDGITEDLYIQLSKIQSLKVISQRSALGYKNSEKSLREIANDLKVNFVVMGSVRKQGNQVRISTQLVQAREEVNLWAEQYNFELQDVFAIQSEVSSSIAKELRAQITPMEAESMADPLTDNVEAYQLYLRGRQLVMDRSLKSLQVAEGLFTEALQLDPDFMHAKAELANVISTYASRGHVQEPEENFEQALQLCAEVEAVDPNIPRIYDIAGIIAMERGDFKSSLESYQKGLKVNPNDVDLLRHTGILLSIIGRPNDALIPLEKTLEIDPSSPWGYTLHFGVLNVQKKYDEARKNFELAKKAFPGNTAIMERGKWIVFFEGKCEELVEYIKEWPANPINDQKKLAICYCTQENIPMAQKYLDPIPASEWPFKELFIARMHGDKDKMFEILTDFLPTTYSEFPVHPAFDILRDDPRYEDYINQSPLGQVNDADVEVLMKLIRK